MSQPTIRIHLLQGRNLAPKDLNGYSDPFVTVKIDKVKVKSKFIKKTLNPDWYEVLELAPDLNNFPALAKITCWDKDTISKDFMGEIKLPLLTLFDEEGNPKIFDDNPASAQWYTLQRRVEEDTISGEIRFNMGFHIVDDSQLYILKSFYNSLNMSRSLESLTITNDSLSLNTNSASETDINNLNNSKGLLYIDVISASDLPFDKNATGTTFDMDPFVVVSFGSTTSKTSTIRHNLNPVWNERLVFQVTPENQSFSIKFSVYDYDKFSNNDFVGSANIPFNTILAASSLSSEPTETPEVTDVTASIGRAFPLPIELTSSFLKERFMSQLLIRAQFVPFEQVRRDFWVALTKTYDADENGNMNKTEISTMLASLDVNINEEDINKFFTRFGKDNDKDELTFSELSDCLEDLVTHAGEGSPEQLFKLEACPICRKKIGNLNHDLNVVSHIAVCASKDPSKVDRIVMGNFITEAHAQRKWFTKIAKYVGYGEYKVGENNANILVQDRETGEMIEEKMPTYIKLGIRLLYKGSISPAENSHIKRILYSMSVKQGKKFNDPNSVKEIEPFIEFHKLSREEILDPLETFKNFNEFFYRKLKPGYRILGSPDPKVAVSPADSRVMVFPTISNALDLWIKGEKFSIERLFDNKLPPEELASFEQGSMCIFRLAPQDYHRFHIPVDGILSEPTHIDGQYFTVNPMAIRSSLDVYGENKRCFSFIKSEHHGKVGMICVGAMMVGSIVLTSVPNQPIQRMDEHGYFAFGGSTILVLFQKGTINFDADLVRNSSKRLETLLRVGSTIGFAPQ
ncbi:hypothetical protein K502DRAFT_324429 [Neoconidiobolus thromboides FSU 785]|nr:hypothetical protein K502DRAFT_324429 [Neoconidiobolus thromboides FSU 785]